MKVGDKVIVRDDLTICEYYGDRMFTHAMSKYSGKVGTVEGISCDGKGIVIKGFNCDYTCYLVWSKEMLEPINKEFSIFSTPTKFFIEKDGEYTEIKDGRTIDNVLHKYPEINQDCYIVRLSDVFPIDMYIVDYFQWTGYDYDKRLFDSGHIFTDREKAQEVADKFNKIIREA